MDLSVQHRLLRGTAAPTAAQLTSAAATVIEALASNPFLRGDSIHPIIQASGAGSNQAVIAMTLCDGRGQALVQPVEVTVSAVAVGVDLSTGGAPAMTLTGTDFTTFLMTPDAEGNVALGVTFGAAAVRSFAIRHPYCALPVATLLIN